MLLGQGDAFQVYFLGLLEFVAAFQGHANEVVACNGLLVSVSENALPEGKGIAKAVFRLFELGKVQVGRSQIVHRDAAARIVLVESLRQFISLQVELEFVLVPAFLLGRYTGMGVVFPAWFVGAANAEAREQQ